MDLNLIEAFVIVFLAAFGTIVLMTWAQSFATVRIAKHEATKARYESERKVAEEKWPEGLQ